MAVHVARDHLAELLHIDWPLRTRPHQAHFAEENIDQLRKFIDIGAPDECAQLRAPRIVLYRPARAGPFGVLAHRAKLQDLERFGIQPHPFMRIEDRPRAVQLDQQRHQQQKRAENHQPDRAAHQIHSPLECKLPALQRHIADRHQRKPAEIADRHLARHDSKRVRQHANTDLFPLTQADDADQLLMRILRQRDDHFVDGIFVDYSGNVDNTSQDRHIEYRTSGAVVDDADYLEAELRIGLNSLQNHAAGVPAADQQHAVIADSP